MSHVGVAIGELDPLAIVGDAMKHEIGRAACNAKLAHVQQPMMCSTQ